MKSTSTPVFPASFAFLASCLALFSLLAGCASERDLASLPAPSGSNARIYFYRTSIVGFGNSPVIEVDGKYLGKLGVGKFRCFDCAPGKHLAICPSEHLESVTGSQALTLDLKPGEVCYVKLGPKMGVGFGFDLVTSDLGQRAVASCRYLPPADRAPTAEELQMKKAADLEMAMGMFGATQAAGSVRSPGVTTQAASPTIRVQPGPGAFNKAISNMGNH